MVREIKNCFLLVYHRHKTEEEISKCDSRNVVPPTLQIHPQTQSKHKHQLSSHILPQIHTSTRDAHTQMQTHEDTHRAHPDV